MKQLKNRLFSLSVTWQMIIAVICIILPINIVSIGFALCLQQNFVTQGKEASYHLAQLSVNQLDGRIYSTDTFLADSVDNNPYVLALRSKNNLENYKKNAAFYWQQLDSRVEIYNEADAYFFYLENEDYVDVAVTSKYNSERRNLKTYIQCNASKKQNEHWYMEQINGHKWLIHIFGIHDYYYGAMIHIGSLEDSIKSTQTMENTYVTISAEADLKEVLGMEHVSVKSSRAELFVHIQLNRKEMLENMPVLMNLGVWLTVILILGIPALIFLIRRLIISPLKHYEYAFRQLEQGDLEYRLEAQAKNKETTLLNEKYNTMVQTIKQLKIEVYEKEMQRMDVEATNLKLQVRPHFILNCLNIIFSMAKLEKLSDIKMFTKYLSDYFRHSLWNISGMVTLKEELACIRSYVKIQEVRFPGAFVYIEDVDPLIEHIQIPTMIIMNFVENALKYALKMGSEISLILIIRKENDSMLISLCDTGNGMDSHTLETLRNGEVLENDTGKHIGIWNCRRRLALIYGDAADIHLVSSLGDGTQIFIQIPLDVEENINESIDRG